jgi:hypothetical protein
MTADATEFLDVARRGATCEETIESESSYLTNAFHSADPDDLTARLDEGVLDATGNGVQFEFCTANETNVTLDLIDGSSGWQVDLVTIGQEVITDASDESEVQPCHVTSKSAEAPR